MMCIWFPTTWRRHTCVSPLLHKDFWHTQVSNPRKSFGHVNLLAWLQPIIPWTVHVTFVFRFPPLFSCYVFNFLFSGGMLLRFDMEQEKYINTVVIMWHTSFFFLLDPIPICMKSGNQYLSLRPDTYRYQTRYLIIRPDTYTY